VAFLGPLDRSLDNLKIVHENLQLERGGSGVDLYEELLSVCVKFELELFATYFGVQFPSQFAECAFVLHSSDYIGGITNIGLLA
jgi:hypothetical protein